MTSFCLSLYGHCTDNQKMDKFYCTYMTVCDEMFLTHLLKLELQKSFTSVFLIASMLYVEVFKECAVWRM